MRLLPRYVMLELVKVFAVTVTTLTMMMMLVVVVKEAIDQGLGLVHIVQMSPYVLPNALVFALPGSTLFAASVVYGRMSGSNEIVAVKSLGISPMHMLWPAYLLAFLLSLGCVWLNDVAVSWGFNNMQRIVIEAIDDIAYGMLKQNRSFNSKRFSIHVRRVEGRQLIKPVITFAGANNAPSMTINAQTAELRCDTKRNILVTICRDGIMHAPGQMTYRFDVIEQEIPLHDASGKADMRDHPAHVALRDVPEVIERRTANIERTRRDMAVMATFDVVSGDLGDLTSPYWTGAKNSIEFEQSQLSRILTEPPRRWANGFSCLCFVLIGAPMAIRLRNADVFTSFFACFLPILIVYYPLLIYGVDKAKDGDLPNYCVWLGNGILALWGLWLTRRVVRF